MYNHCRYQGPIEKDYYKCIAEEYLTKEAKKVKIYVKVIVDEEEINITAKGKAIKQPISPVSQTITPMPKKMPLHTIQF